MSYPLYLRHDQNDAAYATVTASATQSGYSAFSVVSEALGAVWRTATELSAQWIEFDMGFPVTADLVVIAGHNLTSAATVLARAGSTAAPDGSEFEQAMAGAGEAMWAYAASAQTFRYWRIMITDAANPNGFLAVGYAGIGAAEILSVGMQFGWQTTRIARNRTATMVSGETVSLGVVAARSRISAEFGDVLKTERDELDDWLSGLRGDRQSMIFIPDAAGRDGYYGRVIGNHQITQGKSVAAIDGFEFESESPAMLVTS